jgi:hypothetical protein
MERCNRNACLTSACSGIAAKGMCWVSARYFWLKDTTASMTKCTYVWTRVALRGHACMPGCVPCTRRLPLIAACMHADSACGIPLARKRQRSCDAMRRPLCVNNLLTVPCVANGVLPCVVLLFKCGWPAHGGIVCMRWRRIPIRTEWVLAMRLCAPAAGLCSACNSNLWRRCNTCVHGVARP